MWDRKPVGGRKRWLWGSREKPEEEVSGGTSESSKEEGTELHAGVLGWRRVGNGTGLAKEQVCPMGETHTEAI